MRKRESQQGKWVPVVITAPFLALFGWFFYASLVRPWRATDAFFDMLGTKSSADVRQAFAPDRRQDCCSDASIAQWQESVRGRSGWSFGRKAGSMGRTRGGKWTASARGYIHYPSSSDERSFSLTIIEIDGTWYYDSFMVGARATPR